MIYCDILQNCKQSDILPFFKSYFRIIVIVERTQSEYLSNRFCVVAIRGLKKLKCTIATNLQKKNY